MSGMRSISGIPKIKTQRTMKLKELNEALKKEGLTIGQLELLRECVSEPQTMTEVSLLCGTSTASATGMIDRMARLGIVERKLDVGTDRRTVHVVATVKGRKLVADLDEKWGAK